MHYSGTITLIGSNYLYWDDHQPPHFHAKYAEFEILVNINTLEVIEGKFPKRARSMVIEWALDHRDELLEGWEAH